MATNKETNKSAKDNKRSIRQREGLQNAYAVLIGEQNVQSFTAFTLEEAMDALIEDIEGADTEIHPNALKRVDRIRDNVIKAVEEIRNVDPSLFVLKNEEKDVNTPP